MGVPPPAEEIAFWVREISESMLAWLSWVMWGWSQLWLPIHMPAAASARTEAGLALAYWPSLNKVALRPFWVRALSRLVVVPPCGPSSKVRPT